MVKIYDTLHEIYPELGGLADVSPNKETEQAEVIASKNYEGDLGKHIESVNKEVKLNAYKDNKWVRDLNKIITAFISSYKKEGGVFMFIGATNKVGSSTVSYWSARLLASFQSNEKCLYVSLVPKKNRNNVSIINDLTTNKYTVDELVKNLKTSNLSHLILNLDETNLHAPATPRLVSQIINQSKTNYHWVIIDSPPLFSVPGMFSLASETDGAIIVAKAQSTRIPTLNAISKDLEECGAKILGVILNRRVFPLPQFLMKYF
jgi:hypothetical protein